MKIDTDLRAAIRSAEKAQPSSDYQKSRDQERATIAEFLNRFPKKTARIRTLLQQEIDAHDAAEAARDKLCKQFGLRTHDLNGNLETLEFASCGKGREAFVKAGGKLPAVSTKRWSFDMVMAELAAAHPKQLNAILKKYGINWK